MSDPVPSSAIYDATTIGRNVLTAADVAAIRELLSVLTDTQIAAAYAPISHAHVPADITGFGEAVDDEVASLLVAGTNISITYNDAANTLTIASTATGTIGGSTGATDNRVLRSDGTGGSTLQNSPVTIDDSGNVSGVAALTASGAITATDDVTISGTSKGIVFTNGTLAATLRHETYLGQARFASNNYARFGLLSVGYNANGQSAFIGAGGWASNLVVGSSYGIQWSSLTLGEPFTLQAAVDLSIHRKSSGAAEINSGTLGSYRDLFLRDLTASGSITAAGAITASGALNLAPITKAALLLLTPNAATGGRWRVTDATPASREAYPDGTNWRYTSDDTVVT